MPPLLQNLTHRVAPIAKPEIFFDDNLSIYSTYHSVQVVHDDLSIYDNINDFGLEINCRIGQDIITNLPLACFVIEPSTFPLKTLDIADIPQLSKPSITANLVQLFEAIRVFGMNYQ